MILQKIFIGLVFGSFSLTIGAGEMHAYSGEPMSKTLSNQRLAATSGTANKPSSNNPITPASENEDSNFTHNAFRTTDEETELLLQEILNLSSDIAIESQEDNGSQLQQVIIIVTLNAAKLFDLSYIELKINSQIVAAYQYSKSEVHAMQLGGGHRIYMANLSTGIHKLSASMLGRVPRDPAYKKNVTFRFIAGISRTVLEINIDSKNSTTYPELVVKEWD